MLEIVEVGNFNYLFNFVHHWLEAGIIFVRVEQAAIISWLLLRLEQ